MKIRLLIASLVLSMPVKAIIINTVSSITASTVPKYDKFEIGVSLLSNFTNPYNPSHVSMYAIFTDPNGKTYKRDAFWYQPFNRCNTCANNIIIPFVCDWQDVSENDIPNDPNRYLTPQTTAFPWRVRFAPKFNNPVYVKTRNKKRVF